MLYSIVGILVIIIDQAVKFWVTNTLFGTDIVKFIPGVISLVNVHNKGAAFSFLSGSDARIYFIIVTGVFVLLVVIALATNFISGRLARWSLVLVAAGGLGNMIDRIIYGYVVDMFKVELFNFAIFNVADIFITVFAILFALAMIFEKPQDEIDEDFVEDDEAGELLPDGPAPERKSPLAKREKGEKPAKKESVVGSARKARQDKYEKEYQEYKEQQRAAMRKAAAERAAPAAEERAASLDGPAKAPAPVPVPAPAPKPRPKRAEAPAESDPFAAWERANAKVEAEQGYAGSLMHSQPKRREPAAAPAPAEVRAPAKQAAPAPAPQPKPAEQPKPQPKPAPKAEDFSLDDILAEFK